MNYIKKMKGFTLAEATTVLIILGVIAALTIPSLLNRQKEVAERAKIKKAWEIYDAAISSMRADHPMMSQEAFTAWANQPNCPNTVSYFKTVAVDAGNGCSFKTPDGIWFDISDIMHPEISLGRPQTEDNTFNFVVSYNPDNLTFSVNDPTFPGLTNDEKADLKKLFSKLDEDVDIKESASKWVNTFASYCNSWGNCAHYKYDYDSNGNMTAEYRGCDSSGNNCFYSEKYDYDSKGNKITYYYNCDGSGNNCSYLNKYDYDSNGNMIAEYNRCDVSGNNCSYLNKYDYDSNGNKIAYYYNCDSSGNNCRYSYKDDYDSNGNKIAEYACDGSGNNCSSSTKYDYDSNGNKIAEYSGCDVSGNNCSYLNKYDYDSNGNMIAEYNRCDVSGNNCSYLNKYDYDSNGNKIALYYICDGSGNNCSEIYNYSYTEIK